MHGILSIDWVINAFAALALPAVGVLAARHAGWQGMEKWPDRMLLAVVMLGVMAVGVKLWRIFDISTWISNPNNKPTVLLLIGTAVSTAMLWAATYWVIFLYENPRQKVDQARIEQYQTLDELLAELDKINVRHQYVAKHLIRLKTHATDLYDWFLENRSKKDRMLVSDMVSSTKVEEAIADFNGVVEGLERTDLSLSPFRPPRIVKKLTAEGTTMLISENTTLVSSLESYIDEYTAGVNSLETYQNSLGKRRMDLENEVGKVRAKLRTLQGVVD